MSDTPPKPGLPKKKPDSPPTAKQKPDSPPATEQPAVNKDTPNPPRAVTVMVKGCARCGKTHEKLVFQPFLRAAEEFTHWTPCPVNGEPILMKIIGEPGGKSVAALESRPIVAAKPGPPMKFYVVCVTQDGCEQQEFDGKEEFVMALTEKQKAYAGTATRVFCYQGYRLKVTTAQVAIALSGVDGAPKQESIVLMRASENELGTVPMLTLTE